MSSSFPCNKHAVRTVESAVQVYRFNGSCTRARATKTEVGSGNNLGTARIGLGGDSDFRHLQTLAKIFAQQHQRRHVHRRPGLWPSLSRGKQYHLVRSPGDRAVNAGRNGNRVCSGFARNSQKILGFHSVATRRNANGRGSTSQALARERETRWRTPSNVRGNLGRSVAWPEYQRRRMTAPCRTVRRVGPLGCGWQTH